MSVHNPQPAQAAPKPATPCKLPALKVYYPHMVMPDQLAGLDDFTNVCRVCAIVTNHVYPIFKGDGIKFELADKIRRFLQIKVQEGDGLPGAVCGSCARALISWPALRRAARFADLVLRRRFACPLPPEPKPSETAGTTSAEGKYIDAATDPRPTCQQRVCSYCPLTIPSKWYNNHLTHRHVQRIFRCDECHSYLDKDDLLFHMSRHAAALCSESAKQEYYKNEARIKAEDAERDRLEDIERKKLAAFEKRMEEAFKRERDEMLARQREAEQRKLDEEAELAKLESEKEKAATKNNETDGKQTKLKRKNDNPAEDPNTETEQTSTTENTPPKRQKKNKKDSAIKSEKKENELSKDDNDQDSSSKDNAGDAEGEDDDENTDTKPSPKMKTSNSIKKEGKGSEYRPIACHVCPTCGKEYRASSSYFYHMKYFHKRTREHECEVCHKKFTTKANLTQHASIHSDTFDLECKECGKRFRSKPSLYIHEQSHIGVKRWACGQCERSFRWRTHLARHVQRHTAARAHVCAQCGRGFSVRCDLLRHARTHAAAEFHCATCGLKFAQKRYLKVHMLKKHADEEPAVETRS